MFYFWRIWRKYNITANAQNNGCNIIIAVTPKGFPYLLWSAYCEKVAQEVFSTFSKHIKKYIYDDFQACNISFSPANDIKKFKELLDIGAITQEEFDAKKYSY